MHDARKVYNHISNYVLEPGHYLRVQGAQGTSIGMWDKLSIRFSKSDLMASADTRDKTANFPHCSEYVGRRCTKHQKKEIGLCRNQNDLKEIACIAKKDKTRKNGKPRKKLIWKFI
jgi:hypothetical protein